MVFQEGEGKHYLVGFPAPSLALFFACAPLSERLEQASGSVEPPKLKSQTSKTVKF